jgi:ABC-2 type transport system ATP-binding protein
MISVSHIVKTFGDIKAVNKVSFNTYEGEIFGIVGPDGSGKSTLLRMLSAILLPDSGKIEINNSDIFKNSSAVKEKIAYMPQRFGLYEDLTVEENIYFFGHLFNVPKKEIRERLKKLYEFSRLGPFSARKAGALSGGMKQKLGLACALIHSPELILLDEPTNGVDPVSRREFWKILYDLLVEGVTIIVTTAYLDEAERCSRIALMHNGKFIRTGNPADIRKSIKKKMLNFSVEDPIKAGDILKKHESLHGMIRTGTSLKFFTDNAEKTRAMIKNILNKNSIKIHSVKIEPPSLEDSFLEIINTEKLIV